MAFNPLTEVESEVIIDKGTETPFTGEYDDFYVPGSFICRRCNTPLFSSKSKFDAHCGWPAFDQSIEGALKRQSHTYGRTEILCNHCDAHLGHEFTGEGFTETNTRHCVNSVSIKFIPEGKELPAVLSA
jgi:peptide-methionine (R)-S-oxide reductase